MDLVAGQIELDAWVKTSEALQKLGFEESWDSDGLNEFHKSIVLWGECLATLRRTQTVDVVMGAMSEALLRADQARAANDTAS